MADKRTVVLGASTKPERFSNRAMRMLLDHGHSVVPVHPLHHLIEGLPVVKKLGEITGPVDTVTVYLSPQTGEGLAPKIIALHPRRVIMNPGAESDELERQLRAAGIDVLRECTLVLLSQNRY